MYDANISLILKKGKDEMDPASYRPIALLNSDLKIFTKILANRLNKCITKIIHSDQTGFIPGHFSFFNVSRLMNILYSKYDSRQNVAILSIVRRPGWNDPMTAVVPRVKGFACYSLSFSRHNKNIKMEHFFLYILSRYFIWLHKWKGFNDICASLKYENEWLIILFSSV